MYALINITTNEIIRTWNDKPTTIPVGTPHRKVRAGVPDEFLAIPYLDHVVLPVAEVDPEPEGMHTVKITTVYDPATKTVKRVRKLIAEEAWQAEQQAAAIAALTERYARLRDETLEILARLSQYAVEYSLVIDPQSITFTQLYDQLWGVIPPDDYERLRVLYENEVVAFEYRGDGRQAREDFPGLLYLAQLELQGGTP